MFVKVSNLENSRDGYNVYVKVVSAEHIKGENQTQDMVRAVVGDETASANAFFKGENAKLIKEGAVIAIRNGKIRLVKGHISLEVDIFGRVTEEKVEIATVNPTNISEKEIARRPRQKREDKPRREGGERREERQPRENRREPREHREHREPREQRERREPREHREPREPREAREPRENRRDYERRPRPQNEEGNNRPKITWTKVGSIEPGDEGLNLLVKVHFPLLRFLKWPKSVRKPEWWSVTKPAR